MKFSITAIFALLLSFLCSAQNEPCAFDRQLNQPGIHLSEKIISGGIHKRGTDDSIKTIPVVVHIIHNGGSENISETQVQSAIDVLNEDYGKLSGSAGDGAGVDTKVRFCLTKIDPSGNCTNGIVRIKSTLTDHKTYERATLKELSFWDNTKYLNIYVVKTITGSVLGYSSFPGGPAEEDGIVIRHNVFGRIGTASSSMGRTATHELGHWLGLYHTFNNSCGTDICADGDYVCDTPPANEPNYSCTTLNTCANDSPDVNDQKENYMDYTPDGCKNMLTAGQRDRIQSSLENIRTEIWSTANLIATGCDTSYIAPANCPAKADLVCLTPEICIGNGIYFMDKSLNDPTSWSWTFEGGTPSSSTAQNPTVTYNTLGNFDVKLVVSDGTSSDSVVFADYIIVSPPGTGDSLSFGQNFDDGLYPPLQISINNYDEGVTWELDSTASVSGNYSIKINNLINTNYGSSDELVLPDFDFTTAHQDSIIKMTFKWAYARSDPSYSDELIVLLSTDCGVSFSQVFYRSGNTLVTGPTQTTPFVPDSTQWKDAFIYLDTYQNKSNVQIKIVNVTDGGNNLYLDDIYVGDGSEPRPLINSMAPGLEKNNLFRIYPNPATETISIKAATEIAVVEIYNITGQLIHKSIAGNSKTIAVPAQHLTNGMYFITLQDLKGRWHSEKILVSN